MRPSGPDAWRCRDPEVDAMLAAALVALGDRDAEAAEASGQKAKKNAKKKAKKKAAPSLSEALALRLPEVVRSNALAMSTGPELICHPDPARGHVLLSGLGLYHEPSFFNHSCSPSVARYHLGVSAGFASAGLSALAKRMRKNALNDVPPVLLCGCSRTSPCSVPTARCGGAKRCA